MGERLMSRRRRFTNNRISVLTNTAFSALSGFAVIIIFILAFAFIATKIDVTDKIISVISSAALCAGAYAGGFISAKKRRKNGLFMGILCGLFMFFIIIIISTFFVRTISGFSPSLKLILTLIFGAVGGIVGVNSKNSRF